MHVINWSFTNQCYKKVPLCHKLMSMRDKKVDKWISFKFVQNFISTQNYFFWSHYFQGFKSFYKKFVIWFYWPLINNFKSFICLQVINTDLVSTCFGISNQLSIQIAFAYVGNEYNKQAKILKVVYDWNSTISYHFRVNINKLYFFKIAF